MKYFIFWFFILTSSSAAAQILNGTYTTTGIGYKQHFTFNTDSVQYFIVLNAGIVTEFKGAGTYNLHNNNTLLITPAVHPDGKIGVTSALANMADTLMVTVKGDKPIVGASVLVWMVNKMIVGMATNLYGLTKFSRSRLMDSDSITVSMIGYQSVHFKYGASLNYIVSMKGSMSDGDLSRFISNKGNDFKIRIRENSVFVKLPQGHHYKITYEWVEFFK